ncbi:MAG: RluA family pseudouridine synthase [Pseudomonadota bacterium]
MTVTPSGKVQHVDVSSEDEGIRLDRWFKRHVPQLSFGQVSKMLRKGEIRLDGKRAEAKTRISQGQTLRIPPLDGRVSEQQASAAPLRFTEEDEAFVQSLILHEDDTVMVLNKPPGLPTQGGSGVTRHLDGLLKGYGKRGARLVHRLDKDTSGVIIVGKGPAATAALADQFRQRDTEKIYHALTVGVPTPLEGEVNAPIEKMPGRAGEKMVVSETGKSAVTLYEVLDRAGNRCALVQLQPLTGRTHQLRVHMAHRDCPILGDGKYGGAEAYITGSISRKLHLHAKTLKLAHPDGGMLSVEADYPPHFKSSLTALGLEAA